MIQPTDLRIGNWVKWPNEKEPNEVQWEHGHWLGTFEKNYPFPEPIPLSEEWLKRMGFILKEDGGYFAIYGTVRFHGDYLELTVDSNGCWYYNFDSSNVSKIVYVHQLQNLFFALTGSELTINL